MATNSSKKYSKRLKKKKIFHFLILALICLEQQRMAYDFFPLVIGRGGQNNVRMILSNPSIIRKIFVVYVDGANGTAYMIAYDISSCVKVTICTTVTETKHTLTHFVNADNGDNYYYVLLRKNPGNQNLIDMMSYQKTLNYIAYWSIDTTQTNQNVAATFPPASPTSRNYPDTLFPDTNRVFYHSGTGDSPFVSFRNPSASDYDKNLFFL